MAAAVIRIARNPNVREWAVFLIVSVAMTLLVLKWAFCAQVAHFS